MIIKCNLKMGPATFMFEVDEKSEMDTLHKAIVLSNPRKRCICGDTGFENKFFTSNKDKEGNTYVNVMCGKCGAKSKLGLYKSGGYFWHEYEKYQKPQETASVPPSRKEGGMDPNEIPF